MYRQKPGSPSMQQQQHLTPNYQPNQKQFYTQYGLPSITSQGDKSHESDLSIYNGQGNEKQMYPSHDRHQGLKIHKNGSQKALPIIFDSYNDRNQESGKSTPRQNTFNREGPSRANNPMLQPFDSNNSSDVYQYDYNKIKQPHTDSQGFHTFKCLPPEPLDRPLSPYKEQKRFIPQMQPVQPKTQSRVIIQQQMPVYQPQISPRNHQNVSRPLSNGSNGRMIQVPEEQYHRYIEHLPMCKKTQEEIIRLKSKNEQVGQKQHFYWQENMTLREENKRLRDLVSHLEKREKELAREKDGFKEESTIVIEKYKQSLLEEFNLLLQRYRLQLQRNNK